MHIYITAVEDSVLYVRGWRNYSGENMNINTPGRVTVSSSSSWRITGIIISASTDVSLLQSTCSESSGRPRQLSGWFLPSPTLFSGAIAGIQTAAVGDDRRQTDCVTMLVGGVA